jgi:hypothetical protein
MSSFRDLFIEYVCNGCFEFELDYDAYIYDKFDYDSLTQDLRQLSEKEAKREIVRYMMWCGATKDDMDDEDRIHKYYKQLLGEPPYMGRWGKRADDYLLFRHYPALDEPYLYT